MKKNGRRNGKAPDRRRHANRLQDSRIGDYKLAEAVEQRFLELCAAYKRIRGVELEVPKELDSAMYLWRCMRVRHKQGDYRHTVDEFKAVKLIAQWTVDVNAELRHQPSAPIIWGD